MIPGRPREGSGLTTLKFIIALVVILLIADFGVRNNTIVPITYHFGLEGSVPLFMVMLVSVFIGFVVAWIAEHVSSLRVKKEAKRLNKLNAELEAELSRYRENELLETEMGEDQETPFSLPEPAEEED
jgi:uncharacterized integral membrane protein